MFKHLKLFTLSTMAFAAASADALEISINNNTESTVFMAFSYLDKSTDKWVVDGWYNIEKNGKNLITLNTENGIYYLYAEFSNGKKIEGGDYSVNLDVAPQSFYYTQDQVFEDASFKAKFVRAKSDGKRALININ